MSEQLIRQHGHILIVLHCAIYSQWSRQIISPIRSSWLVLKHKVVFGHLQDIVSHMEADGLGVLVKCEVVVIGPDYNLMFHSQKQVSPMRQSTYYCQELSIIHIIVALCQIQGLRVVSYRLKFTPIIPLI